MIQAKPIRDLNDRETLLASIGLDASETELLYTVSDEKILHAFLLFAFVKDQARITRVITFPDCEDASLDLGIRAIVNTLDLTGVKKAFFEPKTERLEQIARSIGFVPVQGENKDLVLDVPAFFAAPCRGDR